MILVDTNILLDVLAKREPFYASAEGSLQEQEVQHYDGSGTRAPVEAHQFVALASH